MKQGVLQHNRRLLDEAFASQTASNTGQSWSTGVDFLDHRLPEGGLNRSGLHEIEPFRQTDMPALTGFAFALLSRLRSSQPIIWCVTAQQIGEYGQPYAFGLERYGISPAQIIFVKVRSALDLHFAMEEAIKTDNVAAVLAEGPRPSFTGSRRLSLLCKTHRRPCLLLGGNADQALGSAALTRWQIKPEQSQEDPRDPFGPGLPTWRIALARIRGGSAMPQIEDEPHSANTNASCPWRVSWDDQTHSFRSATVFSNRKVREGQSPHTLTSKTVVGRTG